jgi:hypothetical protein
MGNIFCLERRKKKAAAEAATKAAADAEVAKVMAEMDETKKLIESLQTSFDINTFNTLFEKIKHNTPPPPEDPSSSRVFCSAKIKHTMPPFLISAPVSVASHIQSKHIIYPYHPSLS